MGKVKVHTFSGPGAGEEEKGDRECVKGKESEESLNQSES